MSNNIPVLTSQQPIADAQGLPTAPFFRWMNAVKNAFGVSSPASVGAAASPFVYTANANGYLIVSGGAVTKIEYSADGKAYYDVGQIAGMFPLSVGASLRITYTAAPILTFVPGAA